MSTEVAVSDDDIRLSGGGLSSLTRTTPIIIIVST